MKWKMILIGIAAIASIMTISIHGGIAFADPQHCDGPGWPLCYSVGFDNGKANPGTSCPSGHSENYCRGWEHGSGIVSNLGSRLVPDRESKPSTSDVGSNGRHKDEKGYHCPEWKVGLPEEEEPGYFGVIKEEDADQRKF